MKNWKSNEISTLLLTVLFTISMLIAFSIIDWFTGLSVLLFGKLDNKKIKISVFFS